MKPGPSSFVESVLRSALLECKEEEIVSFFVDVFEKPLVNILVQDDNILAETVRQKLKQTMHIKNYLLTLRKK